MYQDTREGPSAYVGEAAEGSSGRRAHLIELHSSNLNQPRPITRLSGG